jgi:hypothetical protein
VGKLQFCNVMVASSSQRAVQRRAEPGKVQSKDITTA